MTSKLRKFMFLVTVTLAGVALLLWCIREREPEYQGKILSEWCKEYAPEKRVWTADAHRVAAAQAIREIGTNALPFLLEGINCKMPSAFDSKMRELGGKLPGSVAPQSLQRWSLGVDTLERRETAAFGFHALGAVADPAIPELTRRLNGNDESACYAARALFFIGDAGVPALAFQLTNASAPNRWAVLGELRGMAMFTTNGSSLIPLVSSCITNSSGLSRISAVSCLAEMAAVNPMYEESVVPALTRELESAEITNGWARLHVYCVEALGGYGQKAKVAAPVLQKVAALDGYIYHDFRVAATNALLQIAPEVLTNAPPK